ncbi:translation initiation factor 2 [Faecalibacterium prausnitzii]|uniref:Translation initiation factor 2 n=1 Tax=Faecalibacterium prausnitzii TaxID=853 RepID=A0A2A6ZZT0_9FIRM|nr:translation initiation factor 2 [Faecalibacterium prausnitzii]PDX72415.1 translation initiation factor 2 [Faecalibacterium prausnitzii]
MKGIHKVVVGAKYLKYEFELRRNLTIIRGDSATGKTTLVDMIRTHMNDGESGPVTLNCDKSCYVVEGNLWKGQLDNIQDSIVFIDEGNEFVKTKDFARAIQQTDNYYVIVTREGLPALPYSVEEVYGIRTSGKYGTLKRSYHSFYRIYPDSTTEKIKPEKILTEDSNSGYQFFDAVCTEHQMQCDTANGKSNVFSYLKVHKDEKILVIADGAAFGPEMDRVLQLVQTRKNLALYLPESFEWLILSSGILKDAETTQILQTPSNYIDSKKYFSWERYFTELLTEKTSRTYLNYTKKTLNEAYLNDGTKNAILRQMGKLKID